MKDGNRDIIHTIINYRFNCGNFKPANKQIRKVIWEKHELMFNRYALHLIHTLPEYIAEVFELVAQNDWATIIEERAIAAKKSPIIYMSSLFGITFQAASEHALRFGIFDSTSYQKDYGGRETSDMRKQGKNGQKDCAVRALSLATDIDYDNVLEMLQSDQKTDPTQGTYRHAWQKFLGNNGWVLIPMKGRSKRYTLANLIMAVPALAEKTLIVNISRHIFFVDNGTIRDTYNPSHKIITLILVRQHDYGVISKAIDGLSDKGLSDQMLKIKRESPNMSWTKVYEDMNISRGDGYRIRRSYAFQSQLTEFEQSWVLKPAK